jgi:hypothetical protein
MIETHQHSCFAAFLKVVCVQSPYSSNGSCAIAKNLYLHFTCCGSDGGGSLCARSKAATVATFIFSLHVKLKCDAVMLAKQLHAFCCRIGGAPLLEHTQPHCENFGSLWGCTLRVQKSGNC